jgi:MFS family permease
MTAVLLAPISTSFNSFTNLSWIATTYLIGVSAAQPVVGHLTDVFGRREALIAANATFALGSLICGLSRNLPTLLAGRSIQGFGGGAVGTIAAVIETDLVSLRNRGATEVIGGILCGVCLAAGGLFGGGLNDAIGWRWAFLIQVPMMVVSTAVIWILVRVPKSSKSNVSSFKRIDYVGLISILVSVVMLQIGIDSGGNTLPWTHPLVLTSFPLAFVALVIFVIWDLFYALEPVIPIRLLKQRNIAFSCILYFFTLASYYSNIYYLPIYLQARGYSTTQAGLRFITQGAGTAVSLFGAGLLIKRTGRYYHLNVAAMVVIVTGSGLLIMLRLDTGAWAPFVFLGLLGAGFGAQWVATLMALLSSITNEQQAVLQSSTYLVRCLGMVVGFAISSAGFQKVLKKKLKLDLLGRRTQLS